MKDPHNTVERLTKALESMATGGSAPDRAQAVLSELFPLLPSEFPRPEAQTLFEAIISFDAVRSGISLDEYEKFFQSVWDLYWQMSSNREYK
ncbi:hypothetical protein [Pseudomonas protegens]|uniref:hypothetical protein n=1 Tax=Pseudomonas protegens TaxID=380021 RepID=UPI00227DAAB7|nr:hypothetical protein [Pseudomonas protegens]MCY7264346.1 hypothetical protein [Pseudomonas protegens]MDP9514702.1 hypothetical protein [Pseudomonas protegens]